MMAVTAQAYFHEGSRQLAHGQACEAARSFQRAIDAGHAESHAALTYMHYGTYRGVPASILSHAHIGEALASLKMTR